MISIPLISANAWFVWLFGVLLLVLLMLMIALMIVAIKNQTKQHGMMKKRYLLDNDKN